MKHKLVFSYDYDYESTVTDPAAPLNTGLIPVIMERPFLLPVVTMFSNSTDDVSTLKLRESKENRVKFSPTGTGVMCIIKDELLKSRSDRVFNLVPFQSDMDLTDMELSPGLYNIIYNEVAQWIPGILRIDVYITFYERQKL